MSTYAWLQFHVNMMTSLTMSCVIDIDVFEIGWRRYFVVTSVLFSCVQFVIIIVISVQFLKCCSRMVEVKRFLVLELFICIAEIFCCFYWYQWIFTVDIRATTLIITTAPTSTESIGYHSYTGKNTHIRSDTVWFWIHEEYLQLTKQ